MCKKPFFEKCKVWWWGGYYISVRNSINYHIEKKHITETEKELYQNEFGEKILSDREFFTWYESIQH